MIDFVKLHIVNTDQLWLDELESNQLLEFKTTVSTSSGELSPKKEASYKGMKFIIHDSGYILLQGSLHKYKNNGQHNYNDFTCLELLSAIEDLEKKFQLSPSNCLLRNLEVGVNIEPPTATNKVLNGLLTHYNQKFKDIDLGYKKGNYKQLKHERYYIKAYNKKLQYEDDYYIPNELMRFELKYVKMKDLKASQITTLADLKQESKLLRLKSLLLKSWSNILLYDKTIDKKQLPKYVRETKIHQWQNSRYWTNLTKQRKTEQKKAYNLIVNSYSKNIHEKVLRLISNKFDQLLHKPFPLV